MRGSRACPELITMLALLKIVPQITDTLNRILDRIPKEEMIAKYHSPEGLKVKVDIEGTEVFFVIREKPATVNP